MTRTIPKKNYIIVIIITCVTLFLSLYLVRWYQATEKYKKENLNILNIIKEISEEDWDNYLIENPNAIVYIMNGKGNNISFEKSFRQYIIDNNISNSVIYINVENNDSHFKTYLSKFISDELQQEITEINNIPNVIVIENRKIVDILYRGWKPFNYDDVIDLIERYEI